MRQRAKASGSQGKSLLLEAQEVRLAIELIGLGARLQVLEAEVSLSRERLTRLYKEIRGVSPPKGMLPFSADWFMIWLPNIHSSLFYNIYRFLVEHTASQGIQAMIDAYRLYLEHVEGVEEPVLSFTRAWVLVRFFDGDMLQLSTCSCCGGRFVAHAYDPQADFVCVICRPPPRACGERAGRSLSSYGVYPGEDAAQMPEPATAVR